MLSCRNHKRANMLLHTHALNSGFCDETSSSFHCTWLASYMTPHKQGPHHVCLRLQRSLSTIVNSNPTYVSCSGHKRVMRKKERCTGGCMWSEMEKEREGEGVELEPCMQHLHQREQGVRTLSPKESHSTTCRPRLGAQLAVRLLSHPVLCR